MIVLSFKMGGERGGLKLQLFSMDCALEVGDTSTMSNPSLYPLCFNNFIK